MIVINQNGIIPVLSGRCTCASGASFGGAAFPLASLIFGLSNAHATL
jgi:hypothetical protein